MTLGRQDSADPGGGGRTRPPRVAGARRERAVRRPPVPPRAGAASTEQLLDLQRSAGNSAVTVWLAQTRATAPAPDRPVLQRSPGELKADGLVLSVLVRGWTVTWYFPSSELGTTAIEFLKGDPAQIGAIEQQITKTLQGPDGKLAEGVAYLESAPVAADVRHDVVDWPGKRTLTRLPARLAARAGAVRSTRLRYPLEMQIAGSTGVGPADLDWTREIAALRAKPMDWTTMVEASRADRFELALKVLDAEAASGPAPVPGVPLHTELLRPIIYAKYAATDPAPSELQTDEMTRTHSEAFLARWLPTIRDVRLVPDGFDVSAFTPSGDLDPVRKALVSRYIEDAAPRTMEKFLLDRWVADGSRRSPEQFIKTADIGSLRTSMVGHLAKDFQRWAVGQPGFRGAFWSDVGQRAAFTALTSMVTSARALQSFNASLADRFQHAAVGELSDEEYGIAKDPYGYSKRLESAAGVTTALTSTLTPGTSLEGNLVAWTRGVAATWSPGSDSAQPVAGLLTFFGVLGGLKSTVEDQQKNVGAQLSREMDVSYPKIEQIIRNEAAYAADFITSRWIPTLKAVALEQITANRDEMKQHLAAWPEYRAQAAAKFRICAHVLEDLTQRLSSGDLDSIELQGQVLTKAHLPQLEKARDFMRDQADAMGDDSRAADKKSDLQEAVDGFERVRKRILSGEYKPVDYTKAVYDAARQRLGLTGYEDWTTMGMALDRWVVVPDNPFLGYAIARWQWEEKVKDLDHSFKVFLALGLLTVASCVVPGAAGLALGALDVAVGVAHGVGQVQDAYKLLDLAKLDDKQSVRGVTVEEARAALRTAWIGLGLSIVLGGAGLAGLFGRLIMKGRGAGKIPGELTHLSALAKVNPLAAEQLIAKIKDLAKVEHLLEITGDSVLLERMMARTTNVAHLEFVLMHGDPRTMMGLIELAGDSTKLGNVLTHAPNAASAERLLKLTDDADGLVVLLQKTSNADVAETLVKWTDPRTATRMLAQVGDEGVLLRAQQKGIRPWEVEQGIGSPLAPGRAQPEFGITKVDLPDDVRKILEPYGVARDELFAKLAPHEIARIKSIMGQPRLPKNARGLNQPGAEWAVKGARSPGDFVDRWEYFSRVKWAEEREAVAQAAAKGMYKNQNLDQVAAGLMNDPAKWGQLSKQLEEGTQAVNQLAGRGWTDLGVSIAHGGAMDAAVLRSRASQLSFGGDAASAYHVQVHSAELALAERAAPGSGVSGQTAAYMASARRTVAEGTVVQATTKDGATSYLFRRSVTSEGGVITVLETRVIARENWALIATHGKPLGKGT